jgi:hypothetical protein
MSSAYGRLAAIRDYWVPRDLNARAEVRVSDINEVLSAYRDCVEQSAERHAAIVKLVGALDLIRETLDGAEVQDLHQIINDALKAAHECQKPSARSTP